MDLSRLAPIKEFNIDGRPWRIDWLGPVYRSHIKDSEPNIDVVLSPLTGKSKDPTKTESVFRHHRRVVSVGIGYLPILRISTVWMKGKLQPTDTWDYKQEVLTNLQIRPGTCRVICAGDTENGDPLINPQYYDFGNMHAKSKCLAINSSTKFHSVIIPMAELIRFYYATSSELAKRLFWGEVIGPHSWISKTAREHAFVDGSNIKIKLERPLDYPSELHTVARIIGYSEAEKGAKMIHESVIRNSVNSVASYPETIFPFEGITTLTCHTKRIAQSASKGLWNLLVLWVDSCTGPFPYKHIILDEGEGVKFEEIPINKKTNVQGTSGGIEGPQIRGTQIRRISNKPRMIRSDVEPNNNLSTNFVLLTENHFPTLSDSKILSNKEYKRERKYILQNVYSMDGKNTTDFATADGVKSKDRVRKLSMVAAGPSAKGEKKDAPRKPALPASFSNIVSTLNFIKAELKESFEYRLVAGTEISRDFFSSPYGICNYFPERPGGKRLSWVYIDPKTKRRRQVLVAEVAYKNRMFYLLEAEHNKNRGDSFTILLLNSSGLYKLNTRSLFEVIIRCALNKGTWFDTKNCPFPSLSGKKIKHSSKQVEALGARIFGEIRNICGEFDKPRRKSKSQTILVE